MSTYLEEFAQRVLAICKEAVPKVDGVDTFFYKGAGLPYFTMRLGQEDAASNSEDMARRTHILTVRYVIGHFGAKYEGENERRLYRDIPVIEDMFATCGWLQSEKFPTPMDYITELGFVANRGLSVFPAINDSAQQVGTEFNIRGVFTLNVEERY